MKKIFALLAIALGMVLFFTGCGEDDKKPKSDISGTWDIVAAVGVEWEEDESENGDGTIINTNDPDEDMIGQTIKIEGAEITIFGDPYPFTYSDGVLTIDVGSGNPESFNVVITGSKTMEWSQDEPTKHVEYEYNPGGDNYLFYQKTWTLERH